MKSAAEFQNPDWCVAGVVAEGGKVARNWLFKGGMFEPCKVSWCPFVE